MPAAFRATYADIKLIKTRQCVQIVFELPIEQFDAAYEVLGGMPLPGKERWFGIAAIKVSEADAPTADRPVANGTRSEQGNQGGADEDRNHHHQLNPGRRLSTVRPEPKQDKPARAKRDWRDVPPAQQAGIRCEGEDKEVFKKFLEEEHGEDIYAFEGDVAETVRFLCGIKSRSELNTNHAARVIWHQLNDQYEAWMRAGA